MIDPNIQLWQYEWLGLGRSPKTLKAMLYFLVKFQEQVPDLTKATRADCLGFLNEITQRSVYSAEMAWRALRSFYAFLEAEDHVESPMSRIKAPKRPEPHVKGVTDNEYSLMLEACGNNARDRAIITLLYETGLRRSELAELKLYQVDIDGGYLSIGKTKTAKPRLVPLSTTAKVALLKYLRKRPETTSEGLWQGQNGDLSTAGVRLMLSRRAKDAGVNVTAHMFRRTFAVEWLVSGGSQTSLQRIAGWSSGEMVERYTRIAGERLAMAEMKRLRG